MNKLEIEEQTKNWSSSLLINPSTIKKIKIPDDLFDKPFDINEWYKQVKKTTRYKRSSLFTYFVYSCKRSYELDNYMKENKSPRCLQAEAVLGETSLE